jgi:hypothetical protein
MECKLCDLQVVGATQCLKLIIKVLPEKCKGKEAGHCTMMFSTHTHTRTHIHTRTHTHAQHAHTYTHGPYAEQLLQTSVG